MKDHLIQVDPVDAMEKKSHDEGPGASNDTAAGMDLNTAKQQSPLSTLKRSRSPRGPLSSPNRSNDEYIGQADTQTALGERLLIKNTVIGKVNDCDSETTEIMKATGLSPENTEISQSNALSPEISETDEVSNKASPNSQEIRNIV